MGPPWRGLPASEIRLATLPSSPLESLSSVSGDVVVGGAAEPVATIWRELVANPLVAVDTAEAISQFARSSHVIGYLLCARCPS